MSGNQTDSFRLTPEALKSETGMGMFETAPKIVETFGGLALRIVRRREQLSMGLTR